MMDSIIHSLPNRLIKSNLETILYDLNEKSWTQASLPSIKYYIFVLHLLFKLELFARVKIRNRTKEKSAAFQDTSLSSKHHTIQLIASNLKELDKNLRRLYLV